LRTTEIGGTGHLGNSGSRSNSKTMNTRHFYRIPLKKPESLFFTAFKNVPKPLTNAVVNVAMQDNKKDLPMNIYN
jgi:hypothetical protein